MCFTPLDPLVDTERLSSSASRSGFPRFTPLDPLVDTESTTTRSIRGLLACFTPLDPLVDTERHLLSDCIERHRAFHSPRSTRGY